MGICYDLVSDQDRVGYELGKGPYGDPEFTDALRAANPVTAVTEYLVAEGTGGLGWGPIGRWYAAQIAADVVAFAKAHPDWRVVNDAQWDGDVVDDEERARIVDEGRDENDPLAPLYQRVGSRFA